MIDSSGLFLQSTPPIQTQRAKGSLRQLDEWQQSKKKTFAKQFDKKRVSAEIIVSHCAPPNTNDHWTVGRTRIELELFLTLSRSYYR